MRKQISRNAVTLGGAASALALLALASACAGTASTSQAAGPEADNPALLIAQGAEVYGNNCARCHNARAAAEKTDAQWDVIISHMRARANLTGQQARAVRAFLTTVNLPTGGGEAPPAEPTDDGAEGTDGRLLSTSAVQEEGFPRITGHGGDELAPANRPLRREPSPLRLQSREDSVAQGKALTASKGCVGCHVLEGKGGSIGPSLDDVLERRKEDFILKKLADPRTDNPNSVMPNYGLSDGERKAILAYLRSLHAGGRP